MLSRMFALKVICAALLLWASGVSGSSAFAAYLGPPAASTTVEPHSHAPIDVDARPSIARSKIPLIQPRRLLIHPDGDLLIADWGAGTVLKVASDERVTIVADELDQPAGLAIDPLGNLYVAQHAEGAALAGSVVRITSMGEVSLFAEGLTGPTALAFDTAGNLYVAGFHSNSIERITPSGHVSTFVEHVPSPAAIAFDSGGTLYVASSTAGTVHRVDSMGGLTPVARNFDTPSDLAFDPEGHLIVANYGGTELSYVDERGETRAYAVVPKGTIAHQFDAAGNLLLLNWDLQFLMKVTTVFEVPCPHCGKPIPIRLRQKQRSQPSGGKPRPII